MRKAIILTYIFFILLSKTTNAEEIKSERKTYIKFDVDSVVFNDQSAMTTGIFLRPNDYAVLQGGMALGNDDGYGCYIGIKIALPTFYIKKK